MKAKLGEVAVLACGWLAGAWIYDRAGWLGCVAFVAIVLWIGRAWRRLARPLTAAEIAALDARIERETARVHETAFRQGFDAGLTMGRAEHAADIATVRDDIAEIRRQAQQ